LQLLAAGGDALRVPRLRRLAALPLEKAVRKLFAVASLVNHGIVGVQCQRNPPILGTRISTRDGQIRLRILVEDPDALFDEYRGRWRRVHARQRARHGRGARANSPSNDWIATRSPSTAT